MTDKTDIYLWHRKKGRQLFHVEPGELRKLKLKGWKDSPLGPTVFQRFKQSIKSKVKT